VAEPLELDFWIGLPDSQMHRVTPLRLDPTDPLGQAVAADSDSESIGHLALENTGGHEINDPEAYRAELGANGGITNGRSLARLYAPLALGGVFDGVDLVSPEMIHRMGAVESALATEMTFGLSARFTLGFHKIAWNNGLPESAFGHRGGGGSIGFAGPNESLAFGYVMNQESTTLRWLSLAKVAYQALGYHEGKFGLWI
jgi:CubicO group peptidase (beta-lactamase class C family)